MGFPLAIWIRNKILSGRTTGGLNTDDAFNHLIAIFEQYMLGLNDAGFNAEHYKNKNVLEIGPGSNLGIPLIIALHGANEAMAADRFSDLQQGHKQQEIYNKIIAKYSGDEHADKNLFTQWIKSKKINYFGNFPLEKLGEILASKFDVILAHHALEHVFEPEKAIGSIFKMLKPGGIFIGICNLRSLGGVYNSENEPLALLKYSRLLWNLMFSKRGGSNRIRNSDYINLFENVGMQIISNTSLFTLPEKEVAEQLSFFSIEFRKKTLQDLSIVRFRLVSKKELK